MDASGRDDARNPEGSRGVRVLGVSRCQASLYWEYFGIFGVGGEEDAGLVVGGGHGEDVEDVGGDDPSTSLRTGCDGEEVGVVPGIEECRGVDGAKRHFCLRTRSTSRSRSKATDRSVHPTWCWVAR
jgi:hypothetical protein